jgi:probable rRNA maturation factor
MLDLKLINLQRKVSITNSQFDAFLEQCGKIDEVSGNTFSVAVVSDSRMKQLNQLFRGKNLTTDVLSFPHHPDEFDPDKSNLGDIVISAEQAQKQAAENGLDLDAEIKQLILHGVLHLCGFDHETDDGEMNARELELREKLGI